MVLLLGCKCCGGGKDCGELVENFCDGNDYNVKQQMIFRLGGEWEGPFDNFGNPGPWPGDGIDPGLSFLITDFLIATVMTLRYIDQPRPGETYAQWEYQSFTDQCSDIVWDYPYRIQQGVYLNCGDSSRFYYECNLYDMSRFGIDSQNYLIPKKDITQDGNTCDLSACPDFLEAVPERIDFYIIPTGGVGNITDDQRHELLSGQPIFSTKGLMAWVDLKFKITDPCCTDWNNYGYSRNLCVFTTDSEGAIVLRMDCDQNQSADFFPSWPPSNRWMYNASEGLPNEFPDWAKNPVVSLDSLNDSTGFPNPIDDENLGIVLNEPFEKAIASEELYRYNFEYKAAQNVSTSCFTNIKINIANARQLGPFYVLDYSLMGLQYVDENRKCIDLAIDEGLVAFVRLEETDPPPSRLFFDYGPFRFRVDFAFSTEDIIYYTCSHTSPKPDCAWTIDDSYDLTSDCVDDLPENDFPPIYDLESRTMPTTKATTGPGTELAKMLAAWGFKGEAGCKCKSMERSMNKWQAACATEPHLTTIIDHLQKEAQKRKLPFVRTLAKALVLRAVRRSENQS